MYLHKAAKITLARAKLLAPERVSCIRKLLIYGYDLRLGAIPHWIVHIEDLAVDWDGEGVQGPVEHASLYLCFVIELLICHDKINRSGHLLHGHS